MEQVLSEGMRLSERKYDFWSDLDIIRKNHENIAKSFFKPIKYYIYKFQICSLTFNST